MFLSVNIVLISLQLCTYGSATTAIQHILTRPLRRGRRDPPPPPNRLRGRDQHPQIEQDRASDSEEDEDGQLYLGAGDAPLPGRGGDQGGRTRAGGAVGTRENGWRREALRQRHVRPKENQRRVFVETLRNADHHCSGDETDHTRLLEGGVEGERERGEGEVAEADQAAVAAAAGPDPAPDAKEVVKDKNERKEQHLDNKEQSVDKKEQPVDKKIKGSNSQHAEQGSKGERTVRPSNQQNTAPLQNQQSQGASAPEQISSLQGLDVSIQRLSEQAV